MIADMAPTNPSAAAPTARRVLIVDDHPLMRQAVREIVLEDSNLQICGEAANVQSAMELAGRLLPELAIVDISLGTGNGLELIRQLKAADPAIRILVLSMHDEATYAERVVRAGAHGYVCKQCDAATIRAAINRVLSGGMYLSPEAVEQVLGQPNFRAGAIASPVALLSDRELQILGLIGRGSSTMEIAKNLGLSIKTVGAHRHRIKEKLNVKHANELVRFAVQWTLENG